MGNELLTRSMFDGTRVIVSPYAEKDGEPETVQLTWRQRLLSWPWRPWIASFTRVPRVPCAYNLANGTLIVHPSLWDEIKKGKSDA